MVSLKATKNWGPLSLTEEVSHSTEQSLQVNKIWVRAHLAKVQLCISITEQWRVCMLNFSTEYKMALLSLASEFLCRLYYVA